MEKYQSYDPTYYARITSSVIYCIQYLFFGGMFNCIGSMIPIYAKELNRNESDFSVLLLARGIAYIIASVVNPNYLIPPFKNINHTMGFITLMLGLIGLIGSYLNNYYALLIVWTIIGVFGGLTVVICQPVLVQLHIKHDVAPWMQAY